MALPTVVAGDDCRCEALQKYRKPTTAKTPGPWNLRKLGKLVKGSSIIRAKLALPEQAIPGHKIQRVLKRIGSTTPLPARTVHLVGMSGFAYAALAANLTDKKDPMDYKTVGEVITKLKKVADSSADDKDCANCRRLIVTLENVLPLLGSDVEHAHMLFLRDCACEPFGTFNPKGKKPDAKFRTTWTAGWFIERVRLKGIDVQPYELLAKKKQGGSA